MRAHWLMSWKGINLDSSPGVRKGGASAPPLQGVTNNFSVPLSAQLVATSCAESGTNREGSRDFGGAEAPPFRQPVKVPSRGEQSRLNGWSRGAALICVPGTAPAPSE